MLTSKAQRIVLGALLTTGASLWAGMGCSSSTTGVGGGTSSATTTAATTTTGSTTTAATTTAATTTAATTTSGTTTSSSSSSGGDAGDGGPAVTLDCNTYCNEIDKNCTGVYEQYPTVDGGSASCLASCKSFPLGTLADTGGQNTLGCRIYHAGAPSATLPATHCQHAGPSGGDTTPSDDVEGSDAGIDPSPGVCGSACASFCDLVMSACTGANLQYGGSYDACFRTCKTFPILPVATDGGTDAGPTATPFNDKVVNADGVSGNFNCRLYHATAASTTPVPHCTHLDPANFADGGADPCK